MGGVRCFFYLFSISANNLYLIGGGETEVLEQHGHLFHNLRQILLSRRQKVGPSQKSLMCATKRQVVRLCTRLGSLLGTGTVLGPPRDPAPKTPCGPHGITIPPSTPPPMRKVALDQSDPKNAQNQLPIQKSELKILSLL